MAFKAANTPAHKALKRLWPSLNPYRQDLSLKCPCWSAKGGQVPALLQEAHLMEAIFQIQKCREIVSSLPLEKVFDHR